MITKYLIRFCAPEVRTMIARLHERPEDFDYGTKWRDLIKEGKHYTWAERVVLRKEWAYHLKNEGRRQLLNAITTQVLNPEPKDRWNYAIHTMQNQSTAYLRAQMDAVQNQASQAAMWNGNVPRTAFIDPQSIYQGTTHV